MSAEQIEMYRERVRSIGISLLGGNSGAAGHYELGIDSISIVNDEDIPQTLCELPNRIFLCMSERLFLTTKSSSPR